ncbi:diguanylate cyclase [Candidatus Xianfuyuplasma coldseepsis]|uniref:Diguanylate cyclase n=1 Tax=Candidatus Xianfuyuplasma coldseepsis TaxID=2782163 RepID=A0A7L7KN61_9MOLU|nr:HD domain-containing phosphohydrolase [Xianfuyuplasma coldseepsis]QMS84191.1 diguanylate cyclase [Xianfuyuplasma coldseepsis]
MIVLTQYNIIPLISFVLYGIILVLILTSNRTRMSRAFSLYIIAMMVWSLGSFLMKTNVPPNSLFWNKLLQIGFVSVPVLLLRFSYVISEDTDKRFIIRLGYILIVFQIVLAYTDQIIYYAEYINDEFVYKITWGAYFVAVIGLFYSGLGFAILVKKVYLREVALRKVGLVLIGFAMVVIGGALNINETIGKYGIDILFNTINALLITYAIYRNKFLEINLIVKRGLSLSVYNIILFTVYAVIVIFAYDIITINFGVTDVSTVVLILVPIFLLMEPIRIGLLRLVEHIFYRKTVDRQIVLKQFSELINSSLELDTITDSLIHAIKEALDAKEVHLLLRNTNKYYLQSSTKVIHNKANIIFKLNHPVIKWFLRESGILLKTHLDNHVLFKGMWDSEKALIKWLNTEIIAPIRYSDTLLGMIIISSRIDDTPYSVEETEFLETILNNAAAIIENAKTMEMMQLQSITDELTKFHNHRHFQEIANLWIRERRYTSFGLAIIDIDQFKIYNDLYGHASGDIALKRIAQIIKSVTTENELLVRFGGEEFVVLYPNLSPEEVFVQAERIRSTVEHEFLLSADIREFLTVTVGISNYDIDGDTLEELITKADHAVLQGKQSGRNKTITYNATDEPSEQNASVQDKIKDAFVSSIYALAATIDAKDHYTYGHSNNVAVLSEALARKAGVNEDKIDIVRNAGLLHDIGKVGIPESVLSKPGFLNDEEYEIMKGHVVQSINIIKHIPNLIDTVPVVISHHERYDGKGYPRGIKGENIPLLGRVICIADAFDAMTTDRPYRKGLSLEQAVFELKKNAGTQFDPGLVELFIELANDGDLNRLALENRPSFNG